MRLTALGSDSESIIVAVALLQIIPEATVFIDGPLLATVLKMNTLPAGLSLNFTPKLFTPLLSWIRLFVMT
jgi:hypothetical protein